MEPDWFVIMFRQELECGGQALFVVGDVVEVERPEILFMGQQVHDFSIVAVDQVFGELRDDVADRGVVQHDIRMAEDDAAVKASGRHGCSSSCNALIEPLRTSYDCSGG